MQVNLKKITTESRNLNTMNIDTLSTIEILKKLNEEDKNVPLCIEKAIPQISFLVEEVVEVFKKKGRLIYVGAGTSGRIGVLDASECPPTFGVDENMVVGVIAGGEKALTTAIEGAEDSKELAMLDLMRINLTKDDIVIGIAASGRTPYVLGAIHYAKEIGAITGCITTSSGSILADSVDFPIEAITGPEPITGSTRMKSGTAQKLICNMISTTAMIRMGKVYENLMVDLKATNQKLISRMLSIIKEVTGYEENIAEEKLKKYQTVKGVILSYLTNIEDEEKIQRLLNDNNGNIHQAIKQWKGEK
jgi:N-acetylmuramic acid 6-phosphate etherase